MRTEWIDGRSVLRLAGAGLLATTGAIHLDLYVTGYRTIPAIGWAFLLQMVAALLLAVATLAHGGRLVAAAGAGFCLSTLGGYLLSVWTGLFGFREVRTTAGIVAGLVEIAGFAILATLALTPSRPAAIATPHRMTIRLPVRVFANAAVVTGAIMTAVALLSAVAAGVGAMASPASTGGGLGVILKIGRSHGKPVLTNAKGLTLYRFALDTPMKSACYGDCSDYWRPVTGSPAPVHGLSGHMGTVRRTGGSVQATYNGHPLYTFVGDVAPGQSNGNHLDLNGGYWYAVTPQP
jgi:predicted lipoprotein with Yx(FWY)xxD motif